MAGLSSRVRGRNNPVGGLSCRRGVEIAKRVGSVTGWAQQQGGEDRVIETTQFEQQRQKLKAKKKCEEMEQAITKGNTCVTGVSKGEKREKEPKQCMLDSFRQLDTG